MLSLEDIFKSPLSVSFPEVGEVKSFELADPPFWGSLMAVDSVPVANVDLADGGGLPALRFDSDPPVADGNKLDVLMEGRNVSNEEFVRLVNASRAAE